MSVESLGAVATGANPLHRHREPSRTTNGERFTLDPSLTDPTGKVGEGSNTTEPTNADSLRVELPNGFTVSATHVGASAFSAQLLSSMEDMIGFLNELDPSSGDASPSPPSSKGATGLGSSAEGVGDYRCLDTFHVDLGDEDFLELHYSTESDGGNKNASAADAMAKAIQSLVGKYAEKQGDDLMNLVDPHDSSSDTKPTSTV